MGEYTIAFAEDLAKKMLAKPPPDRSAQHLNKQGVVRELIPAIQELQARGYTIEQVAESMRGEGFEISTPTLKSYLQRVRGKKARKPRAPSGQTARPTAPSRAGTEGSPMAQSQPAAAAATTEAARPAPPKNPVRITTGEFLDTDRKRL